MMEDAAPIGAAVVRAIDEQGFPVQDLDERFELGYPQAAAHLRVLERGRVIPDPVAEREFFPGTPYSLHMLRRSTGRALTLESPRPLPWEQRIAIHRIAVVAALERQAVLSGL